MSILIKKRPEIIGVTGKARSGKDTVAEMIKKHLGNNNPTAIKSFATPMKRFGDICFGWNDAIIEKEVVDARFGFSPREFYQKMGTEFMRDMMGEDTWVKIMKSRIDNLPKHITYVIIPDVRFDNEAQFIRDNGGTLIEVIREDGDSVRGHVSENGVKRDLVHHLLENNGSLEELNTKIKKTI